MDAATFWALQNDLEKKADAATLAAQLKKNLDGIAKARMVRQSTNAAFKPITKVGSKQKVAFDWHKFREGVVDEGIPLTGATLGAAIGGMKGKGLTGAALGYAAGGAASLARSKLKGEEPSMARRMLAGGALGYGVGGLLHGGAGMAFANKAAKGLRGTAARALHQEGRFTHGMLEEGLPALGATLGTGIAMGTHKDKKASANLHPATVAAFKDELEKIAAAGLIKEAWNPFAKAAPVAKKAFTPSFKGHSNALAAASPTKVDARGIITQGRGQNAHRVVTGVEGWN